MIRLALAALVATVSAPALGAPLYTLSGTIPLGAPDHWDYLSCDEPTGHVLVAHADHTDVIDPHAGKILARLGGLDGAHGQFVAPNGDIFADSGRAGTVSVFNGKTLALRKTLRVPRDADGMTYDPVHHTLVVVAGDAKSATLIDTVSETVRETIALPGKPEAPGSDGAGTVYINIASTSHVVKLDIAAGRLTADYAVPMCQSPHGIAVDAATHRVFTSCRNNRLVVIDTASGRVTQTLPIASGTDFALIDLARHRVFSANGAGSLSIFAESPIGTLRKLAEMQTEPGARTMTLDPSTGTLYLVTATPAGQPAPGQWPSYLPGSVRLLIYKPRA